MDNMKQTLQKRSHEKKGNKSGLSQLLGEKMLDWSSVHSSRQKPSSVREKGSSEGDLTDQNVACLSKKNVF